MIVCLGWGSLCWDSRTLPVEAGEWKSDGPELPVEFTRVSRDNRVTLVITPGAPATSGLWKKIELNELDGAVTAFAERENIRAENIRYSIGIWSAERKPNHDEVSVIEHWALERGIDAVIWTALKPRFMGESGRIPSVDQVIASLNGLEGETRAIAEEYVRRTPTQISTPYRTVIEERLGWTSGDQNA